RIRDDTKERLAAAGFNETNGGADSLVSYHMAPKEQVRKEYVSTGTPGYWFHMGRWRVGRGLAKMYRVPPDRAW
ncbi:MAG: hypothetical protein M3R52_11295, partial [Acidobacteriota bacterium]|nr:hypothetical protein [Acidobacteriota bacterium]